MNPVSYRLFDTRSAGFYTDGVAASSTNVYYSKVMKPSPEGLLGFTLESTGTLTGAFVLQVSDEMRPDETTDTDWDTVTWTATDPAGSATKKKYELAGKRGRFYRIKYTNASGTGLIKGYGLSA